MRDFAKIENGVVFQMMVVADDRDAQFCSGLSAGEWIEYFDDNPAMKGGRYDHGHKQFVSMQPYPSWEYSYEHMRWEPPIPKPEDGKESYWDEPGQKWVVVELE